MSAGREAFDVVIDEVDAAVRTLRPEEDPSWLLLCSGEVFSISLVRRRPNGMVWLEGSPVEVEGWRAPTGTEQLQAARELAEWTCTKARTVMERLALNGAAS